MSQEPPDRTRRRRAPSPQNEGGGWGPTIAMFLGIVVAGLGIGALLGAFAQRGQNESPGASYSAAPAVTMVPQARGPVAIATLAPPHTAEPTAEPTPTPEPSPSPTPAPTATPQPSPVATATPAPAPTTAAPTATPVPTPLPTLRPTPRPLPSSTPRAVAAAPSPPPPIVAGEPLSIASSAPAVVRRYLSALMGGDESGAYAALGGASGDPGLTLSEESFLDPGAKIDSIKTTPVSPMEAQVDAEITSAKGTYEATYRVKYGAHGAYITSHDYIKV
jgi:outer membrane biosynthesis protein TonB